MQKRIFGLEAEYSVALRKRDDKWFYTTVECLDPALLLKKIFPLDGSSPINLRELLFFPNKAGNESFWLGSNGARFYFDLRSSLPEYATPECTNPVEALTHNAAGDMIVEALRQEVLRQKLLEREFREEYYDICIFKMNTSFRENEGNQSVGFHENYLTNSEFMPGTAQNRFKDFCNFMVPFFQSRQIFDGAGGIWKEPDGEWSYVISPRAFFIYLPWSDDTTGGQSGRGFFNFRSTTDECLAGTTRLHVLCGDHHMSPKGKYIAMAATHLVLRAIEEGKPGEWAYLFDDNYFKSDYRAASSDLTLRTPIRVKCGEGAKKFLPVELQREYANFVAKSVKNLSAEEKIMFRDWTMMIDKLSRDPMEASREIDWVIKLNFLRERCGGNLKSDKSRFASVLYHDISPRGLYNVLLRGGAVDAFIDEADILSCRLSVPKTRAEFRSRYIKLAYEDPEGAYSTPNWGTFSGIGGPINLPDPLARTTEEGDRLMAQLRKIIMLKKSKRS